MFAFCRVEVQIASGVEEQSGAAKKTMEGLHAAINPAEHLTGNKKENRQKTEIVAYADDRKKRTEQQVVNRGCH